MLKIAVCDDLFAETEALKTHIERYARENILQATIAVCSEAPDILAVLEHAAEYDVVFLDINMEELNGIVPARHLRKQGALSFTTRQL